MSVQRSPPRPKTGVSTLTSDSRPTVPGGSHPDLRTLNMLAADSQITFRKRKQPSDQECNCSNDLKNVQTELSRISTLLEKYVCSNEQILNKMQENISEIKNQITELKSSNEQTVSLICENITQINELKSSTSDVIIQQDGLKNTVTHLEHKVDSEQLQIKTLQTELNILKNSQTIHSTSRNELYSSEQFFKEMQDRSNREKNIILSGVPEQTSADFKERSLLDQAAILEITMLVGKDIPKPIQIIRIGKYMPGKTRRLKVCYDVPGPAKTLLRNKDKLPPNIKIFADQTPTQQKYLKQVREELLRRQNDGEPDITIKYVNGTPTIIKVQPKNLNPPTTILQQP